MNAVERLWRAIARRDWDAVTAQFHASAVVERPASGEHLTGPDAYALWHRLRPDDATVTVVQTISGEQRVAVHAVVTTGATTEHVMGFYDLQETRIARAVELWVSA